MPVLLSRTAGRRAAGGGGVTGTDVGDVGATGLLPESQVRQKIWREWLPDIYLNPPVKPTPFDAPEKIPAVCAAQMTANPAITHVLTMTSKFDPLFQRLLTALRQERPMEMKPPSRK